MTEPDPGEDRRRARSLRRRPARRQARGRGRAAQSVATPAGRGRPARRDRAEEHHHDRPDRRREDRDRAPARAARARAVPQGRGEQVHRGRLRRSRRRFDRPRSRRGRGQARARRGGRARSARARRRPPRSVCSICCCRAPGAQLHRAPRRAGDRASADATREKLRAMLRDGKLDDREVEVELSDDVEPADARCSAASPASTRPRCRGSRTCSARFGRKTKRQKLKVPQAWRALTEQEVDKLIDHEAATREAVRRAENAGIVFIDEIDKIATQPRSPRRRRLARGRAARPAADRRGLDGDHQVRPGADGSRAVHRRRRVPHEQAERPDPRDAGPVPDPRRAHAAGRRGLRPDPHRAARTR